VHCWADLQSVHGFRCYDNTHLCKLIALYTANAYSFSKCQRVLVYSLCGWLAVQCLTLCKGLGVGLEVQSLGLGLVQKGLVLVLGNFWSLGLEEKVLFTSLL